MFRLMNGFCLVTKGCNGVNRVQNYDLNFALASHQGGFLALKAYYLPDYGVFVNFALSLYAEKVNKNIESHAPVCSPIYINIV